MQLRYPPPMRGVMWGGRLAVGLGLGLSVLMATMIVLRGQSSGQTATAATNAAAAPAYAAPPAPVQPIPYSHKRHLALGLECRQCHVNPDAGEMMTFPATSTCMSCHQAIAADRPPIQKLAAYAKAGTPVPWVRVYDTPDYVFWSHGAHLQAKVACVECHGPVAERDVMAQETDVVTMLGCRRCHDARQVFTDCGDCHEPRQ
jgi:hypothetical protein